MNSKNLESFEVFFSYSHKDERLLNHLRDHLALLRNQRAIKDWHDRRISGGREWERDINEHLDNAKIILFLISASFMASDYCNGVEVTRAMERHRKGEARVIPIILRDVEWEASPFGKLQALPTNAKPVTSWRDRNQAFRDIARGVAKVIAELRSNAITQGETTPNTPVSGHLFLNHTSFLREYKQDEFRRRTGVPLPHYDIRVIVDSYDDTVLDQIERVEYVLDDAYPEPIRIRTARDRGEKFLLKELANGEYVLGAKVFLNNQTEPVLLERYITLWHSGPELPFPRV